MRYYILYGAASELAGSQSTLGPLCQSRGSRGRIVITRRGKPIALLSPVPRQERTLSAAQEAALERLLNQSHHLGGRAPSRDELYER